MSEMGFPLSPANPESQLCVLTKFHHACNRTSAPVVFAAVNCHLCEDTGQLQISLQLVTEAEPAIQRLSCGLPSPQSH